MVNMGENEWLNGYLEAILDVGNGRTGKRGDADESGGSKKKKKSAREKVDDDESGGSKKKKSAREKVDDEDYVMVGMDEIKGEKVFSPRKYFVEEVVNSFDEADLHRTWIKVIATRNSRLRNNRLENMCWRIWHLARRKKQIAWDAAKKLAIWRLEREKGRNDAAQDLSELSEGGGDSNKNDSLTHISRIHSDTQIWPDDKSRQLYIVLISLHGLVRGENMELGRDSDTGGQVKYVVELARALANMESVHRVDLLTRQITSPEVDSIYCEPIEMLCCPSDGFGSCGAYIVRIPCGPPEKYIPKESLWPYIPEFIDGALSHIVNMARALGEQVNGGKAAWPYVIHGHYADAGEVAARLSAALNVPTVITGHSLGRNKLEQLLKQGRLSRDDINATFKIMRRIEAEELGLDCAEMVVTSTRQEIEEQWGLYDGFDIQLERKLRIRKRRGVSCLGRCMPRMLVIPPGMDFSSVAKQASLDSDGDLKSMIGSDDRIHKRPIPPIWSEIMRFFTNPHKPMILALSRPDPKKNVTTLLKAFGECQHLRELANLTLILGNRDNIEDMSTSSSSVLTTVLKLIDQYDLYGQVAYPKHHNQPQVPEIYRLAAKTKGVFINPALVEPFGLTLIEAAAYGLPIVATKNGGPVDILKALNNGLLVDPHDQKAISDALLKLVADKNLWQDCRKNGLKNIHKFSWPEHCRNYLSHIEHCRNNNSNNHLSVMPIPVEPPSESLRGIEDLSLKFSFDVDAKAIGELDSAANHQQRIIDILLQKTMSNGKSVNIYGPGRRQWLYVIAVDGSPCEALPIIIKNVMQVSGSKSSQIGIVLLTGLSLEETKEILGSNSQVKLEDFDALVCSSGSEMCYPWRDLVVDEDYTSHIEYRWPGENVKSMVTRLAKTENTTENDDVKLSQYCSRCCFSYSVKQEAKTLKIEDLKQRLRMRGLRCNLVYTHAATRLNVVPLFASRAQALRYLSVKWSIDLSKVILFMGERGDTDYEDLLGGLHKTVILRGLEMNVHSDDGLKKDDIVISQDSMKVALAQGFGVDDISKALGSFGIM